MNKNIEHYIFHKEHFLDEEYCKNCIKELDKNTWRKHEWYRYHTDSYSSNQNEPDIIRSGSFSDEVAEINNFILLNYLNNKD